MQDLRPSSAFLNQLSLSPPPRHVTPNLHLGTQGFTYPSWVGPFYPPGTPSSAFLTHYAAQFATVELDTTFYAIPRASTIAGWRERTPEGFLFAAKFPQAITHQKALTDCGPETIAFLDAMTHLDRKLGPLLLQMPPSWGTGAFDTLAAFLQNLPTGFRYALEVRHRVVAGPCRAAEASGAAPAACSRPLSGAARVDACAGRGHRAVRLRPLAGPPRGHPRR